MTRFFSVLLASSVVAVNPVLAATQTSMEFTTPLPVRAAYSQGFSVGVRLLRDGAPVVGPEDCGLRACAITLRLARVDGVGGPIDITEPDVAVDAEGNATVRVTLVDGRYGGAFFAGNAEGLAYTMQARFRGFNDPTPAACDANEGGDDLCASDVEGELLVQVETPSIELNGDQTLTIGGTITLAATLTDPTGVAEPNGEDVNGPAPSLLANKGVVFFFDVNDDGSSDPSERLNAEPILTNQAGVASLMFTADPAFAQAGVFVRGLQAEFPGDDQYSVTRATAQVTIEADAVDPAQTILVATPDTIPANGSSTSEIKVTLVDGQGNVLGPDAPPSVVVLTASLGQLLGEAERNVLDGTYTQVLRSTREAGTSTITATVDGTAAGSVDLLIEGQNGGCKCGASDVTGTLWWASFALLLGCFRRRQRGAQVCA
jgi:hypothetical protein